MMNFLCGPNGVLSAGVGVNCYYSIFEHLGYKMHCVATGKTFDAYQIDIKL